MSGFHAASDYVRSSFFILLLGGLMLVLSYGFPYWTTSDSGKAGLWKGCNEGDCYDRWNQWNEPWIRTVQAFMTAALVTWAGSVFCVFCYIWVGYFNEDKRMVFLAVLAAAAYALFSFIGIVVWSASQHLSAGEVLNWAYAIAWGSWVCGASATWFLVMELRTPVDLVY